MNQLIQEQIACRCGHKRDIHMFARLKKYSGYGVRCFHTGCDCDEFDPRTD